MVWTGKTAAHDEAAKIRFECVPYVLGRGIDLGLGAKRWAYPHAVPIEITADADIARLGMFAEAAFDFAFSSYTLPALTDPAAALAAWWRLVKVGGYLLVYLPHGELYPRVGEPGCDPRFTREYTPEDLRQLMQDCAGDWDLIENQRRNGRDEAAFLQVYRKLESGSGQRQSWQAPAPAKRAAVVRYGAYGDALWASSILPALKTDGYHVTVYTQEPGAIVLRHDPHVDRIIDVAPYILPAEDMIAHWQWERVKYQVWINLIHSVEARILWTLTDVLFHAPDSVRQMAAANVYRAADGGEIITPKNYLEEIHRFAEVPYLPRQKFYPSADEMAWAQEQRTSYAGPVVVLNPRGSTWPKWWPYSQRFVALLAKHGVHTVIVGDHSGEVPAFDARYGHYIGRDWPIRQVFAFAALADCVVGEESAVVNSVAFESVSKVVLLSHSPADALTRDWLNTVAIEPRKMPCYPCHRIHKDHSFCVLEKRTQAAGCQAIILPETVAAIVLERLGIGAQQVAA